MSYNSPEGACPALPCACAFTASARPTFPPTVGACTSKGRSYPLGSLSFDLAAAFFPFLFQYIYMLGVLPDKLRAGDLK